MILSLWAAVKSPPYRRRKSRARNCEAFSGSPAFSIPEITSFLPEANMLLAILNRSEGVRDNSISLYRCSVRAAGSLMTLCLSQQIAHSKDSSPLVHVFPIELWNSGHDLMSVLEL